MLGVVKMIGDEVKPVDLATFVIQRDFQPVDVVSRLFQFCTENIVGNSQFVHPFPVVVGFVWFHDRKD